MGPVQWERLRENEQAARDGRVAMGNPPRLPALYSHNETVRAEAKESEDKDSD